MEYQKRFKNWLASLETESNYKKFLTKDMIQKLLSLKDEKLEKQEYSKTIIDPLSIALEFYKEQSDDNYKRIIEGIQSGQITVLEKGKPYVDTKSGNACILLNQDDSDVFCLVHEFAHFIDRNHKPTIVPDSHWFWQKAMLSTWKND